MVTRELLVLGTAGYWPVGSSSKVPSSDFKKFLFFVGQQGVHHCHLVLGHLVENLFETLDLVARQPLFLFEVFELLSRVTSHAAKGNSTLFGLGLHDLHE